jgi:hypothetical protein
MPAVGSNTVSAKLSSTWKSWSNFWARHSGIWKKPLGVWVKRSGSWVKIWDERPSITNVVTSYVYDPYSFPPSYTYYKNFTCAANGFDASLSATTPNPFGTYLSVTTVAANATVAVTSETLQLGGSYDPAQYPTITATNVSGVVTF